jgi:hypothetical protein
MTEQQSSGNRGAQRQRSCEMEGQSSIKHVVEMNLLECSDELMKKVEESDVLH